jgi:fatty acid/phospholipid biosynthesis enzyme
MPLHGFPGQVLLKTTKNRLNKAIKSMSDEFNQKIQSQFNKYPSKSAFRRSRPLEPARNCSSLANEMDRKTEKAGIINR